MAGLGSLHEPPLWGREPERLSAQCGWRGGLGRWCGGSPVSWAEKGRRETEEKVHTSDPNY